MKTLEELIHSDPAIDNIEAWAQDSPFSVEIMNPEHGKETLHWLQVSTRSTLGCIAYYTGGILIQNGWLRILGSGSSRVSRTLKSWNENRSDGFLLIADDVLGGFFALNGGSLGKDTGLLYYLAPDLLSWEALEIGYTDFIQWSMTDQLNQFYDGLLQQFSQPDMANCDSNYGFHLYPPLWSKEGSVETSSRRLIPISELYDLSIGIKSQLDG